jgi:hypothetical protein
MLGFYQKPILFMELMSSSTKVLIQEPFNDDVFPPTGNKDDYETRLKVALGMCNVWQCGHMTVQECAANCLTLSLRQGQ